MCGSSKPKTPPPPPEPPPPIVPAEAPNQVYADESSRSRNATRKSKQGHGGTIATGSLGAQGSANTGKTVLGG